MREGDALNSLRNSMLEADNGVYNVGIITSPASGELIISMYAPILEKGQPIGYVGAGTYVNQIATHYSDVSKMNLDTAYVYFVDNQGTILFHPDEEKLGTPIDNSAIKKVVDALKSGEHPEPECVEYEENGEQKYASYYVAENESYIVVLVADKKDILSSVNVLTLVSVFITVALVIIFVTATVLISKIISKSVKGVVEVIKETANGNLYADTNIHSMIFEINSLIESAKTLQNVLQKTIGETQNISASLKQNAEIVASLSEQSNNGAIQISQTVEEMAHSASTLAGKVQSINEQIVNMSSAVDIISENVTIMNKACSESAESNQIVSEYMDKLETASTKSVEAVKTISERVGECSEAAGKIQETVEMISSIAGQTNLLALNASIEAARAGEAGRGFAVVASEINNLSEQSNASAKEIHTIIDDIIRKVNDCVAGSNALTAIIDEQMDFLRETETKIHAMSKVNEKMIDGAVSIDNETKALVDVKNSVINSICDLSAISEENAANNQAVAASVGQVTVGINSIATDSEDTKKMANRLHETVEYFK